MNNDFRLKFLSILVALSLACFSYARAREIKEGQGSGFQGLEGQFSSQLSELTQENEALEAKIKALDKAKAKLERTIVKKKAAAKYIQDKLTEVSAKKNKFKKQVKALEADCAILKKELEQLNTSYNIVKEKNIVLAKGFQARDKAKSSTELKALDKDKIKLESELARKAASIRDLQARLEQNAFEKKALKRQIITLKDGQRRLKSEIGELNNDLELTMKKNTALNREVETFWGTIKDSLKNQILALTDERAKLENRLSAADKNYKLAQEEIASLIREEAVVKGLQAELTQAGSERAGLKKQILALTDERAKLENRLSAADKNYKLAQGEITFLKEDLGVLDKANAELKSLLGDNETKIKDMKNRLVLAGSEKANLQKQLKSAEGEGDKLKGELEALNRDYKLAKEKAGYSKTELNTLGQDKIKLEADLAGKTASIEDLQARLEQSIPQRKSLKKQAKSLEDERKKLEADLAGLNKYHKVTKEENFALKKELKDSQLVYIKEANVFAKLEKENNQLIDELARETQRREELDEKWKEINKELVLLQKSTPAGRKEKKETLTKAYEGLAMRGSKFSQEELAKDKEKIYQALGYVYLLDGDFKKAIAAYKKVLKLNPFAKDVYYNLGYLYTQIGKYKLAVDSYQKALKGDKSDDDIYYNLALIYGKYLRNEEKSNEYYEKISEE